MFPLVKIQFVNNYYTLETYLLFLRLNILNGHVGLWETYVASEDNNYLVSVSFLALLHLLRKYRSTEAFFP